MSDTSASRHARLGPMLASLLALLLAAYPVSGAADPVTSGVRAVATALAGNDPPLDPRSETSLGFSSVIANVSQSGQEDNEQTFASGLAAASLPDGTLRVLAIAAGPSASGTATAAWNTTVRLFFLQAADWAAVFRITGHISGDNPLVNIADFDATPGDAIVRSGNATAMLRATDVSLFGDAVLAVTYHADSEGAFRFPLGVELSATAGDNGHVNFSETVTAFLELPDGATFLGDDSGLLFANRTNFIIHPGDTLPGEPVPEPSPLGLSVIGVLALALARFKGRVAAKTAPSASTGPV